MPNEISSGMPVITININEMHLGDSKITRKTKFKDR